MPLLSYQTLSEFNKALEENKIIQFDDKDNWDTLAHSSKPIQSILTYADKGNWDTLAHSTKTIRSILTCKDLAKEKRLLGIIKAYTHFLNEQESIPVVLNGNEQQKKRFMQLIITAKNIFTYIEESRLSISSLDREIDKLNRSLVGLQYRIEEMNGGLNKLSEEKCDFSKALFQLEYQATRWLRNQEGFRVTRKEDLDPLDRRTLRSAICYPGFIGLIKHDYILMDAFFKWCLRDVRSPESVDTFIQFPALCDALKKSYLDKHAGYHDPSIFKIRIENQEKVIKMPFYVEHKSMLMNPLDKRKSILVNVLDKNKIIEFDKTCKMPIHDIFKRFEKRNDKPDNVDFFEQGFINWNSARMAWTGKRPVSNEWSIIDFQLNSADTSWWLKLPTFLSLDYQQVLSRYHLKSIPPGSWVKCAIATCDHAIYSFVDNHGALEIAIPVKNRYQIYPFGLYPVTYSSNFARGMCGTVRAEFRYPEDCFKFTSRMKAFYAKPVSEEDGLGSMSKIHNVIQQARKGNLFFQPADQNCARMSGDLLESKEFPSCNQLYGVRLRNLNPMPWKEWIFLNMPTDLISPIMQYFAGIYQFDRENENGEMEVKKVIFTKNAKDMVRSLPPHLLFQIINQRLPAPGGFLTYANEPIEHKESKKFKR